VLVLHFVSSRYGLNDKFVLSNRGVVSLPRSLTCLASDRVTFVYIGISNVKVYF
jgi:hypothetical protein